MPLMNSWTENDLFFFQIALIKSVLTSTNSYRNIILYWRRSNTDHRNTKLKIAGTSYISVIVYCLVRSIPWRPLSPIDVQIAHRKEFRPQCPETSVYDLYIGNPYYDYVSEPVYWNNVQSWDSPLQSLDIERRYWSTLLKSPVDFYTTQKFYVCANFSNQHLLVSSSNMLFEFCDLDCCMLFIYVARFC